MNEFLKMDIFFVTTTALAFVLGAAALVALYYIIKILKSIDHVAQNVSAESDNMREDITLLRGKIRDEGMKVRHFMEFFLNIAGRKARKSKAANAKKEKKEQ